MNSHHVYRPQPRDDKDFWTSKKKKKKGGITINISLSSQPNLLSLIIPFSLQRLLQEVSPDVLLPAKITTLCQKGGPASALWKPSCQGRERRGKVAPTVGEAGTSLATLPGHLTSSWIGLIDQWLIKPFSQVYTLFQMAMVREHVDGEFLKQQGANYSHFPKSTEILKGQCCWANKTWARAWQALQGSFLWAEALPFLFMSNKPGGFQ